MQATIRRPEPATAVAAVGGSPRLRRGAWIVVGVLTFGGLLNFASPSPWERFGWGPFSLILAGLCALIVGLPLISECTASVLKLGAKRVVDSLSGFEFGGHIRV